VKKSAVLEFIKKYQTFLLISAIAMLVFRDYILLISVIVCLALLGLLSIKVSMIVPHISVEAVTASSILLGYLFDWRIGLGFGLVIGMYGYALNGMLKLKSIINVLLMGLCGVIAAIFASFHYSFVVAYMLTFVIKLILNNIIFPMVESDMFENMIHSNGDPLFNMLITYQIIKLIYTLIGIIS